MRMSGGYPTAWRGSALPRRTPRGVPERSPGFPRRPPGDAARDNARTPLTPYKDNFSSVGDAIDQASAFAPGELGLFLGGFALGWYIGDKLYDYMHPLEAAIPVGYQVPAGWSECPTPYTFCAGSPSQWSFNCIDFRHLPGSTWGCTGYGACGPGPNGAPYTCTSYNPATHNQALAWWWGNIFSGRNNFIRQWITSSLPGPAASPWYNPVEVPPYALPEVVFDTPFEAPLRLPQEDPFSRPITQPLPNPLEVPAPYRAQPDRRMRPDRSPTEQPQRGPQPRPRSDPLVDPEEYPWLDPRLRPWFSPHIEISMDPSRRLKVRRHPRARIQPRKMPPKNNPKWTYSAGGIVVTEIADTIDAFWKALPERCKTWGNPGKENINTPYAMSGGGRRTGPERITERPRRHRHKPGAAQQFQDFMNCVMVGQGVPGSYWPKAIKNAVIANAMDIVYGYVGRKLVAAIRDNPYYSRPAGLQFGPLH